MNDPNSEGENGVKIALTKLDVNELGLELHFKIKNHSEHNVWVLQDFVHSELNDTPQLEVFKFEVFMSKDAQTLVLRRRLDEPLLGTFYRGRRPGGTYVLVQSGEDMSGSVSLDLPAESRRQFVSLGAPFLGRATRLALEIGYYDEDLPGLIRGILRGAEGYVGPFRERSEIKREYFRGLKVRDRLGGLSVFDRLNPAPYDDGLVYVRYSHQALTGEKVLRIDIDGVSIPYDGFLEYDRGEALGSTLKN